MSVANIIIHPLLKITSFCQINNTLNNAPTFQENGTACIRLFYKDMKLRLNYKSHAYLMITVNAESRTEIWPSFLTETLITYFPAGTV